ncbi:signal transduction histidine kinase [Mizugakiibacter sediminis]|uniref:histidine kinase n=1 Tax=Mizugakiibacter sediminis TaxID=1475481 RepID=A0A0K8QK62_9GAMM|nr:signal transduction histidine kinase [Mizugakiibacter sediminis]
MLQSRRRLRSRIFVSFALFGLALTSLFAAATIYMRARLEDQLINNTLQREVENFVQFKQAHPEPDAPWKLSTFDAQIYSARKFANVPFAWQRYGTGVYDIRDFDENGKLRPYKLAVYKDDRYWAFLRLDVSTQRLSERQLITALGFAVLIFAGLSMLIGRWLSSRVMSPVSDLARRLRSLRRTGQFEPLAPNFADDEVGELAAALDDYAQRLTELVQRDREFNADVSHELRTPLAVIATTTELLLNAPDLSDKMRDRLKRMERASRQSTELIEALLLLSRAERSGPIDGETTDIARVCADVIDANRPHLGGRPVEVSLRVESPLAVNAPSSVVAVALNNLIGNAIKYTPQGEVVVRVQDGRVLVEDTGPGIKAEDAEKLFQRGVRGEGAVGKGAGLGLAIVRRLCELYGWGVGLRPREGGGAVATLDFQPRR